MYKPVFAPTSVKTPLPFFVSESTPLPPALLRNVAAERVVRRVVDSQRAVAHARFRFRILDRAVAGETGDRHAVAVDLQSRVSGAGQRHNGRAGKLIRVLHDDKRVGIGDREIAGYRIAGSLGQNKPSARDRGGAGIRVGGAPAEDHRAGAAALNVESPRAGDDSS